MQVHSFFKSWNSEYIRNWTVSGPSTTCDESLDFTCWILVTSNYSVFPLLPKAKVLKNFCTLHWNVIVVCYLETKIYSNSNQILHQFPSTYSRAAKAVLKSALSYKCIHYAQSSSSLIMLSCVSIPQVKFWSFFSRPRHTDSEIETRYWRSWVGESNFR